MMEIHTEMGEDLLPWAIAPFVVAVLVWGWFRYFSDDGRYTKRINSRPVRLSITIVLAIAVALVVIGSVYTVIVIGESGAKSVWDSRLG